MTIRDLCVPQMGEGLREVLIHKLLKKPGDSVRRDEPVYIMESDKAVVEIESPWEGILREWLVEEAKVVPVGEAVAHIETTVSDDETGEVRSPAPRPSHKRDGAGIFVPPRTRAYCKSLGIPDDQIRNIPAASGTLMPRDVDLFISRKPAGKETFSTVATGFRDYSLSSRQRIFNFRLARSAQLIAAGTMKRQVDWNELKRAVKVSRRRNPGVPASDFETFAYALAQATREHPSFRSVLLKDDKVREFDQLDLGLAVQNASGELMMAVISAADRLDFHSFVAATRERVRRALNGEDQANDRVPLQLDYVARLKVTDGIPVLIAPAIAVVSLCAPTGPPQDRTANMGVTFDQRLINGAAAAKFLGSVISQVHRLASEDSA